MLVKPRQRRPGCNYSEQLSHSPVDDVQGKATGLGSGGAFESFEPSMVADVSRQCAAGQQRQLPGVLLPPIPSGGGIFDAANWTSGQQRICPFDGGQTGVDFSR